MPTIDENENAKFSYFKLKLNWEKPKFVQMVKEDDGYVETGEFSGMQGKVVSVERDSYEYRWDKTKQVIVIFEWKDGYEKVTMNFTIPVAFMLINSFAGVDKIDTAKIKTYMSEDKEWNKHPALYVEVNWEKGNLKYNLTELWEKGQEETKELMWKELEKLNEKVVNDMDKDFDTEEEWVEDVDDDLPF